MGKAIFGGSAGGSRAFNTTTYLGGGSGIFQGVTETTEANQQLQVQTAGTMSNLFAAISINTLTTAVTTIRFRIGAANGNQVVTFAAGVTGTATDITNTDAVSAGSKINFSRVTDNSGAGSSTVSIVSCAFSKTTGHGNFHVSANDGGRNYSTDSVTRFSPLNGTLLANTTEDITQEVLDAAGTLKNFSAHVLTNGRSTTTVLHVRVNTADGNGTLSVTAGSTGFFQDTSNTDSVTAGNTACYSVVTSTGGGTFSIVPLGVEFTSTGSNNDIFTATNAAFTASATTVYTSPSGSFTLTATSRTGQQLAHGFAVTASKLKAYISANTCTGTVTIASDVNGSAGSQSLSIATTATGFFQDVTHSDTLTSTDLLCISVVGGTANSITIRNIGLLETVAAAGLTNVKTWDGIAIASMKTLDAVANASIKSVNGVT